MPPRPHPSDDAPPPFYAHSAPSTIHTTLPASTQKPPRPLHAHITLDLLIYILSRSLFHPAIVLIAYLSLAALHKHREPISFYVLYWACFLCCVEVLMYVNRRVAYGWPRKVDWEREVVVITGGGGGLGRVLMESLVMRGVKVAVLDVKGMDREAEELRDGATGELCWVECDVGDGEAVERAVNRVVEELGPPTILVNNAAAPIQALPLLPSLNDKPTSTTTATTATLSPSLAHSTLQTNTLSHFHLLHHTLPHLLRSPHGAHIITLSSILSHLSPSHLSAYSASKAAISSLHESLTHEIHSHPSPHVRNNIKTLLVEVGQMDTGLFAMTRLPGWVGRVASVVETKDVVRWITWYVERGEGGVLRLPFWAGAVGAWWGVVPGGVRRVVRGLVGVDRAVRTKAS